MRLPQQFIDRMKELLNTEFEQFIRVLNGTSHAGLRVNTLKASVQELKERLPFNLEPVPWSQEGFYIKGEDRPAKHPYYQAGLFYLQEPSAMAPAACLGVRPGDKVLDLCAAPGGKSTHIAALLQGEGFLLSNDNSEERTKALVWNLERWGTRNCTVTNEEPKNLARCFPDYFDKILIDAPCSGEGMFRKDARAVKSWNDYDSETCSAMQADILDWCYVMLKPGGRMLYSTCTFNPEENEQSIAGFLTKHSDVSLLQLPEYEGWARGETLWAQNYPLTNKELYKARRLWPHKVRGEGHFLALMEKKGDKEDLPGHLPEFRSTDLEPFYAFMEENLTEPLLGPFIIVGHSIYRIPTGLPALKGLKVFRPGWHLGIIKNRRFQPSQALALGLKERQAVRTLHLEAGDEEVKRYLKGETLMVDGPKGWTLVCLEEFPLGWGKQAGDYLKNHYPPGWRLMND